MSESSRPESELSEFEQFQHSRSTGRSSLALGPLVDHGSSVAQMETYREAWEQDALVRDKLLCRFAPFLGEYHTELLLTTPAWRDLCHAWHWRELLDGDWIPYGRQGAYIRWQMALTRYVWPTGQSLAGLTAIAILLTVVTGLTRRWDSRLSFALALFFLIVFSLDRLLGSRRSDRGLIQVGA